MITFAAVLGCLIGGHLIRTGLHRNAAEQRRRKLHALTSSHIDPP